MQLRLQDTIGTGVDLLDAGITDLEIAIIDGEVHLYSSTGRNGGLVHYTLGENGQMQVNTTVIFPPEITGTVGDQIVLGLVDGELTVLVGSETGGLYGYDLLGAGGLGDRVSVSWSVLQDAVTQGQMSVAEAMILLGNTAPETFPTSFDCGAIIGIADVTINGVPLVVAACDDRNGVTSFIVDTRTGALTEVETMGALQGLGIHAPTALEVVQIAGQTYVIVAAAGTDSITVMRLNADGSLEPTDHRLDNGTTRFEGVQSLAVGVSGDHAFVVAGGADNGLSLFLLLPDGTLVHLQTLADTLATAMHKVTSITAVVDGDTLFVFVGSQNDAGITQFTIDLSGLGSLIRGTAAADVLTGGAGDDILMAVGSGDRLNGGAGDDVLVTGEGQTDMIGGRGSDIFVIRDGSGVTHILDFERGIDALDLSGLPMLRDLSQLAVTVTAAGAVIEYRGHTIRITAQDGRPLTLADLFPGGLIGGDRIPLPPPEDEVGIRVEGGKRSERIEGTDRNDTLIGGGGSDTLIGGSGDDVLDGGARRDWIETGPGNNLVSAGGGRDLVFGGDGNDTIDGGGGKDKLFGGGGADVIHGGAGNDRLYGQDGNDLLFGGDGNDRLLGGDGNDTLDGGADDDRLFGYRGDDSLIGGDGNDSLYGGGGRDTLEGGDGNDLMYGGAGHDLLLGGAGNDTLIGNGGNDTLHGGDGRDLVYGGTGNDTIYGGGGNDLLHGQAGHDLIRGGTGNDAIWGGGGNDTIRGDEGDDWLSGEDGNDLVVGGAGNDVLRGGRGDDTLIGGAGADVFEFFADHDTGRILDFNLDEGDRLRLDDAIWAALGTLTAEQVVAQFGSLDGRGQVVLDFSDLGGCVIILSDFDDLTGLVDAIDFM
jgi:Ca2+-binding RTX toxin-like protein